MKYESPVICEYGQAVLPRQQAVLTGKRESERLLGKLIQRGSDQHIYGVCSVGTAVNMNVAANFAAVVNVAVWANVALATMVAAATFLAAIVAVFPSKIDARTL